MLMIILRVVLASSPFILVGCASSSQGQFISSDCQQIAEDNRQLREALTKAIRTVETDQAAFQDLDKSLKTSAQEIVKLREELLLYRNILVPPDGKSGLRVQNLEIQPVGANGLYSYKLLLVQSMKHETTIHGTVTFRIVGLKDGQESTLAFPSENKRSIQVKLKYFQEIEGKFELPRGFQPHTVKVHVVGQGGTRISERVFEWPRA